MLLILVVMLIGMFVLKSVLFVELKSVILILFVFGMIVVFVVVFVMLCDLFVYVLKEVCYMMDVVGWVVILL